MIFCCYLLFISIFVGYIIQIGVTTIKIETTMRKNFIMMCLLAAVISSCGTYTGTGTYIGAQLGGILGSAIGGISNGGRGSDIGTIIGMAGGAAVGGAIGSAKDKADRREVREHYEREVAPYINESQTYDDNDSGFDPTGSGDDRLYDFNGPDYTGNYSASEPTLKIGTDETTGTGFSKGQMIEIRNARFVDDDRDGIISTDEISKVIFEVVNASDNVLYDLQPMVEETTDNKRIYISPSVHVEALEPGKAVRYTAMVKAGKMKDGEARFKIYVTVGGQRVSAIQEFGIKTIKNKTNS